MTITVIALVAVVMGLSTISPMMAYADHYHGTAGPISPQGDCLG